MQVKYPNVTVKLIGEDGNAFSIMGRVCQEMEKAGISSEECDSYMQEAMNQENYDAFLAFTMKCVNVK